MLIDEAARVSDEIYEMLCPMPAVGDGDLWLMSTPREKAGFFYLVWELGGAEWERVTVKATECERIPKRFLEEQRAQLGAKFHREYMCEFLEDRSALFGRDVVDETLAPLDLDSPLSNWKRP